MAPNKFEKQLKDTLERRTIAPSKNAWSQLDDTLQADQNKRKFPFWWLGIAATFSGVFLAVFLFEKKPDNTEVVVNKFKNEVIIPDDSNVNKKQTIVDQQTDTTTIKEIKTETKTVDIKKNKKVNYTHNIKIVNTVASYKNKDVTINNNVVTLKKETVTNPVIAANKNSSKEVSLLLDKAYAEIKTNQTTYKSEKIDVNSLLEEVEIQSEKSLKNRLFHAVKSGYKTIKTAVVQRHN